VIVHVYDGSVYLLS